jgi:hypothetical protein
MPSFGSVVEEPVERETLPWQRREQRVIEGKNARGNQRRCQKHKEQADIDPVAGEKGGVRFDRHQLRATVLLSVWPESFRPPQTTSDVKASSRKPNAAPDSQL